MFFVSDFGGVLNWSLGWPKSVDSCYLTRTDLGAVKGEGGGEGLCLLFRLLQKAGFGGDGWKEIKNESN